MTAEITGFERKLPDALRACPDRPEMWIGAGDPLRNLIDLEDSDALLDRETKSLFDLARPELLHRNKRALWGRIRQAWIQGGDFIYFPPAWAHCVRTYQPSLGLGGYAMPPADAPRMDKVLAWYAARELDPQGGIWRGTRPLG